MEDSASWQARAASLFPPADDFGRDAPAAAPAPAAAVPLLAPPPPESAAAGPLGSLALLAGPLEPSDVFVARLERKLDKVRAQRAVGDIASALQSAGDEGQRQREGQALRQTAEQEEQMLSQGLIAGERRDSLDVEVEGRGERRAQRQRQGQTGSSSLWADCGCCAVL
eukprot:m51a1_g7568 hypothetical protein (168) ;mRNA; r:166801-167304